MTRIHKAIGHIQMPFVRIGGHLTFPPPVCTRIQTDGSFGSWKGARIAAVVMTEAHTFQSIQPINATDIMETEWASIALGLKLALNNDSDAIELENDNLGVINALIHPNTELRHLYARYYRAEILKLAARTTWTGVRWIPRRLNKADALF